MIAASVSLALGALCIACFGYDGPASVFASAAFLFSACTSGAKLAMMVPTKGW